MKSYRFYMTHQLARFGVLTVPQMLVLAQNRCQKSSLYRLLERLKNDRYIVRISHPRESYIGYAANRKLYSLVYGNAPGRRVRMDGEEFDHAVECTDTMIELSRYSFVSGLATEYEFGLKDARVFCHGRIPDGILQITSEDQSYELAVEVEHSGKSDLEMSEILSNYRQTFLRKMPCVGLILVAVTPAIFKKYQHLLSELPPETEDRILLTTIPGLRELNSQVYGIRGLEPGIALEKTRTSFQGRGEYTPMITKDFYPISVPQRATQMLGGSDVYE